MKLPFKYYGVVVILLTVALSVDCNAEIVDEKYKLNGNYQKVSSKKLDKNVSSQSKSEQKIEITEFFLYSCPPCFELDPKLDNWVKVNKEKVIFNRIPAVVSPSWVPLAKAYYIAEKLGILEETHSNLFKAIHKDKRIFLNEYSLSEFYENYGINKFYFIKLYNSKEIIDKVSDARILTVQNKLRGVPAIVMSKRYKTAPFFNRDQEQMLDVMTFLLDKITNENKESRAK